MRPANDVPSEVEFLFDVFKAAPGKWPQRGPVERVEVDGLMLGWPEILAPLFLPQGKGALILILGGLTVVAVSLLLSLAIHFEQTQGPATSRQSLTRSRGQAQPQPYLEFRPAPAEVLVEAARRRVGPAKVLDAGTRRCVIQLTSCRSCRRRGHSTRLCNRERRVLQKTARRLGRRPRVYETSCNPQGNGTCTFEVQWRRAT